MLNIIKSGFLIALMSVFLVFVGYVIGGVDGAFVFFAISLVFNFFSLPRAACRSGSVRMASRSSRQTRKRGGTACNS